MVFLRCAQRGLIVLVLRLLLKSPDEHCKRLFQPLTPALSFKNLMYVAQSGQLTPAPHLLDGWVSVVILQ